jgi:hypothetical protein
MSVTPPPPLLANCDVDVDAHRAARRQKTRERRHEERQRDACQHDRIARRRREEQWPHDAPTGEHDTLSDDAA